MRTYLLKRLLLLVPTFLGIALVLFVVVNLAPGRPGSSGPGVDFASSVRDERGQDSLRVFREQFGLDRPVLVNLRFLVTREEVLAAVEHAAGVVPARDAARIRAQEDLDDWGRFAVPHLVALMREDARPAVRDAAVHFLRRTAPRPLLRPFDPAPDPQTSAHNREVDAENAEIRSWRLRLDAPEAEKLAGVARWSAWWDAHRDRFAFDAGARVRIALFETRFATYLANLARLDFGVSLVTREPVLRTLLSKLRYSVVLSLGSLLLAWAISIPLGTWSAVRRDSRADRVVTSILFLLYSLPGFFVATVLLVWLSQGSSVPWLRLFPTGGWSSPDPLSRTTLQHLADVTWHLVLPMICLTYGSIAALSRYMRSGMLEVISADFVRTARAKGLPERVVIGKHALRNALLPIVTLLSGLLPAVLGGSVVIEYVFGIPGMGLWVIDAIHQRDYNVILAVELISTLLVLVGILLTDLAYALVDPRIRFE